MLPIHEQNQVEELMRWLRKFTKDWATRPSRRFLANTHKGKVDLRKTIRYNHAEIIKLMHRCKKDRKLDLVVLADSSRSMRLFSSFTVQLLYAFQQSYGRLETFVFGTRLFRITPWLQEHSFEQAVAKLNAQVPEWSGGTNIGGSLAQFVEAYASTMINNNCLLMIISDGWDTGDTEELTWAMSYLHRRVKKLIWLNPHASKPDYQPLVAGMQAALPYIDIFQGVHDLESLKSWQNARYQSL